MLSLPQPHYATAYLMILKDVNIKLVSEILGHSSIRITLDIYGHLYDAQRQDVAEKMDDFLSGS